MGSYGSRCQLLLIFPFIFSTFPSSWCRASSKCLTNHRVGDNLRVRAVQLLEHSNCFFEGLRIFSPWHDETRNELGLSSVAHYEKYMFTISSNFLTACVQWIKYQHRTSKLSVVFSFMSRLEYFGLFTCQLGLAYTADLGTNSKISPTKVVQYIFIGLCLIASLASLRLCWIRVKLRGYAHVVVQRKFAALEHLRPGIAVHLHPSFATQLNLLA